MTSPIIWQHDLYEDVFEALTDGGHAYASDFAGDGQYLFPAV